MIFSSFFFESGCRISPQVSSNRTTYLKMGASAANLTSDNEYTWSAPASRSGAPTQEHRGMQFLTVLGPRNILSTT